MYFAISAACVCLGFVSPQVLDHCLGQPEAGPTSQPRPHTLAQDPPVPAPQHRHWVGVSQENFTQKTRESVVSLPHQPGSPTLNCASHSPEADVAGSHHPWGLEPLACRSSCGVHSAALHNMPHTLKGVRDTLGPAPVPHR